MNKNTSSKYNIEKAVATAISEIESTMKPVLDSWQPDDIASRGAAAHGERIHNSEAIQVIEYLYSLSRPTSEKATADFHAALSVLKDEALLGLMEYFNSVEYLIKQLDGDSETVAIRSHKGIVLSKHEKLKQAAVSAMVDRLQNYRNEIDQQETIKKTA